MDEKQQFHRADLLGVRSVELGQNSLRTVQPTSSVEHHTDKDQFKEGKVTW